MDVHQYVSDPDSARFGTTYSGFYDAAIHWTDRLVGSLLETLDERGQLLRTVIVVASDHGEAFREHQGEGHARDLYTEVTRTPWIIALPFALEQGLIFESPTSNIDIWPTLLDLLGLESLPDSDGRSLQRAILDACDGAPQPASAEPRVAYLDAAWGRAEREPTPMIAVDEGPLRGILGHRRYRGQPSLEFFDHALDPSEQQDLAAERSIEAERLADLARGYLEDDRPRWESVEIELDAMMLGQLRALGYDVE
jgi:arylsulfatase A-like enzyme